MALEAITQVLGLNINNRIVSKDNIYMRHLIILSILMLYASSSLSEPNYKQWGADQVTVIAAVDVWVRSSEPRGLFCSRGNKVDVLKKGTEVKVNRYIKANCGLFYYYDYFEIEYVNPKDNRLSLGVVSAVNDDGAALFNIKNDKGDK